MSISSLMNNNCKIAEGDVPLRILGLVGSLAVAFRKVEILQCLALWMSVID